MINSISINVKAIICFLALSFIWGSTWSVNQLGIEQIPIEILAYLRNLIAGTIMVSYFLWKGYGFPTVTQLLKFFLLSLLLFTLNNLLLLYSLVYIPSHIAAVIGCTSPLFIYIIYQTKNKLKINTAFILGCVISVVGVSVLLSSELPNQSKQYYFLGVLLSVVAVLAWSIGFLMMEKTKQKENVYYSFAWQLLLSGITLFIFSLFTNATLNILSLSFNAWLTVCYLAVFGSVTAFVCLAYTIKYLPPSVSSLYVFLNPLVAFFISFFFFETSISISVIVGAILTLIGLWVSINCQNNLSIRESVIKIYTGNKTQIN